MWQQSLHHSGHTYKLPNIFHRPELSIIVQNSLEFPRIPRLPQTSPEFGFPFLAFVLHDSAVLCTFTLGSVILATIPALVALPPVTIYLTQPLVNTQGNASHRWQGLVDVQANPPAPASAVHELCTNAWTWGAPPDTLVEPQTCLWHSVIHHTLASLLSLI